MFYTFFWKIITIITCFVIKQLQKLAHNIKNMFINARLNYSEMQIVSNFQIGFTPGCTGKIQHAMIIATY